MSADTLAEVRELAARLAAAEAAGDSAALAGLWLDLHGLQCVDMEEAAADDRTPPAEAAAIIRAMLAEMIEDEGGDPAAILH